MNVIVLKLIEGFIQSIMSVFTTMIKVASWIYLFLTTSEEDNK